LETEIENAKKWKKICMVLLILIPLGAIIVLTFPDSSIVCFFCRLVGYMCMGIGFIAAFSLYFVFPRVLTGLEET